MDWSPQQIRELRKSMNETQEEFAKHFRLCVGAIRLWEQDVGKISGPAEVILDILAARYGCRAAPKGPSPRIPTGRPPRRKLAVNGKRVTRASQ